jgi:DNA-binding FrmR family transcriptional regulator
MTHHLLPTVQVKLGGVVEHAQNVQKMANEEKSYPEIMDQICEIHSELTSIEQIMIQDLSEHASENK